MVGNREEMLLYGLVKGVLAGFDEKRKQARAAQLQERQAELSKQAEEEKHKREFGETLPSGEFVAREGGIRALGQAAEAGIYVKGARLGKGGIIVSDVYTGKTRHELAAAAGAEGMAADGLGRVLESLDRDLEIISKQKDQRTNQFKQIEFPSEEEISAYNVDMEAFSAKEDIGMTMKRDIVTSHYDSITKGANTAEIEEYCRQTIANYGAVAGSKNVATSWSDVAVIFKSDQYNIINRAGADLVRFGLVTNEAEGRKRATEMFRRVLGNFVLGSYGKFKKIDFDIEDEDLED